MDGFFSRRLGASDLPLLVTGVAGVTGFNALPYFRRRYPGRVVGVRPESTWRLNGDGIVGLNLEDLSTLRQLFAAYRFRSVLHCAGNCALKACELDPEMAYRVNVEGTRNLLECIGTRPVRLVYLSSDLVFSGRRIGRYTETDTPDPVTVYGKTMVEAEQIVSVARPDALVLRISLPMGRSFNGHAGAIDWIESRFRKSRPATLYYDEIRTPTYTEDMNRAMEWFLAGRESGLLHFGGARSISLYQIAQIVNRVGGYDPKLLKGCPRADAGPMPPRAGNVALDGRMLQKVFGRQVFQPWPKDEWLMPVSHDWHFARSPTSKGSPEHIGRYLYRYD